MNPHKWTGERDRDIERERDRHRKRERDRCVIKSQMPREDGKRFILMKSTGNHAKRDGAQTSKGVSPGGL